MASSREVWLPIVTFVLGGFLQIIVDVFKDWRHHQREDQIRDRELAARAAENRAAVRRSDLTTLKDALIALNRSVTNPPEEVSAGWIRGITEAKINAMILSEAISDQSLKEFVSGILEIVDDLTIRTLDENRLRERLAVFDNAYMDASLAIGRLVREVA